jgi:hypothetical protein
MLHLIPSIEHRAVDVGEHTAHLRRLAQPTPPGLLRRSTGDALVRIGLLLGGAGDSPRPRTALHPMLDDAPA